MLDSNLDLSFHIKEKIREIDFSGLKIGADSSLAFMQENENCAKPLYAIEIPYIIDSTYPKLLTDEWGARNFEALFDLANNTTADIVSIKFNIDEVKLDTELSRIKIFLEELKNKITKPLIFRGANKTIVDKKLLPFLAKHAPKRVIIAFAEENSYEEILPEVIANNHVLVLRTPIDINIAKELNILTTDKGLSPENILIDPDMGGLGYGLDYGYSIIEKIRQAAFDGDTMLNMPIIAFIGEESYRAKEAKTDSFSEQWGDYKERAAMWETAGATAMISAGANIVVLWNPKSIKVLKGLI